MGIGVLLLVILDLRNYALADNAAIMIYICNYALANDAVVMTYRGGKFTSNKVALRDDIESRPIEMVNSERIRWHIL